MAKKHRRSKARIGKITDMKSSVYVMITCSHCHVKEVKVEEGIESAICGRCACFLAGPTDNMIAAIERKKNGGTLNKIKRPRGWQFMKEFVDAEKNVYRREDYVDDKGKKCHRTIEMPELKGTKEPTVVITKPKISRKEREERKQKKLLKRYEKMKRVEKEEENSKKFFKETENG